MEKTTNPHIEEILHKEIKAPRRFFGSTASRPWTIPEDAAASMIDAYRSTSVTYTMAKGSAYGCADLKNYMDVFNKYANPGDGIVPNPDYIKPPTATGYDWAMASSLMFVVDAAGKTRLTMCLLPVLIDSADPTKVIDFFDAKKANDDYYKKDFDTLNKAFKKEFDIKGNPFKSFIYDEGHLWP